MLLVRVETLAQGHEIQAFATICDDTGNNAVYLHTANPNGTPFPHEFAGVEWGAAVPLELEGVVDPSSHEAGRVQRSESVEYIIRRRVA